MPARGVEDRARCECTRITRNVNFRGGHAPIRDHRCLLHFPEHVIERNDWRKWRSRITRRLTAQIDNGRKRSIRRTHLADHR